MHDIHSYTSLQFFSITNAGEILLLKINNTPGCAAALKMHEDELIEALPEDIMVTLAENAVRSGLVPMQVVSHIKSLDPSNVWPHPLVCRYLFFHVYATIENEKSNKAYKSWLKILSNLNLTKVPSVLSSIEESESYIESMPLRITDIPLLAKVLSGYEFWKQLVYSLPLSENDILKLPSDDASKTLEQLLKKWASKFLNASIELLEQSLHMCSDIEEIKHLDISKLVSSSQDHLREPISKNHGRIDESNCGALSSILKKYSPTFIKYANCLLLSRAETELLTNTIHTMTPEECLNTVLTMWVKNEFQHARPPTYKNLVDALSHSDNIKLKKCHVSEVTSCFKIEQVWPSFTLKVTEGRSALLEVQATCATDSSVAFDWRLKNAGINHSLKNGITNRFLCLSVSIVHVDVSSLEMEGTYTCTVNNFKESQAIHLAVKTPLDEHRNKLTAFHSEQPDVPKDTWPPVSIESYINLALIKQEHITAPNYHTIRGDVDDILSDKEAIIYKAVFNDLVSNTRLLLEGRPGSGKTTLVHKASKDWASGYLEFPQNRLLFLVHLRAFSSNPDVSLHDIIRCYPYSDSAISTISEYAERHNGLGLCFILDGLDEYNPGNDSCFIFRLIRHEIFPKAVVITASRPSAAADFRQYASKQVEVIGFLTQQIYEYVARYPFSEASCDQLCQYLGQHPRVLNTCYLPIHCAMVCCLFNFLKGSVHQTETEIYDEFTKYMILRTLYRDSKRCSIKSLDVLPPSPKGVFNKICMLAYEMTTKSKQAMEELDINFFFDVKESLGLLTVDRTATRLGFQNMYTFLHLTAQEYLAAYYISKLDENEQLQVIEEYGKQRQMQQVWKFFCGLARNVDNSQLKFNALLSHSEYGTLYRVQCCFESQLSHFCDAAVEDSCLSFAENFLSSSNFEEVAYVLSNTKHNCVKKLSFDGCNFGEEEVSVMLKKSDSKKLALVTTLCLSGYHNRSTEQWGVVKYLVHTLAFLQMLDVSHLGIQKECIYDFFENLNHPSLKYIQIGSVGCVLHSVRDLNLMLVEKNTDHPYYIFPYSISGDFIMPVKVLSRKLLLPHPELKCLGVLNNVFSASNLKCIIYKLLSRFPNIPSFHFSHNYNMDALLLKTYSSLQSLDVSFNCLGNKGAETIANILKQRSLLLELNIASNNIGSDGAKSLAEALKTCSKLEKLVLHSNDIRTEGVQALAKSMEHWPNFTSLDVSSNSLTSEAAKVLASGLKKCPSCTFQEMLIGNNAIGDSGLISLASFLDLKKCTTLDIRSNCISATGLEAIASNLQSIQQLDISGNTLDGVDLEPILAKCSSLCKLTLGRITHPDKESLQLLSVDNVIRKNSLSLLVLDVSQSAQGFEALAGDLKHCIWLRELNASHTSLGTSLGSLAALCSCLSCLSQLTTLSLSFSQIEPEGIKLLANGLVSCTNLCKLFIDNNNIGDVGAAAIATVVEKCHQLQVLDVSSSKIGDLGAESLAKALQKSKNLCEFNISHNYIKSRGERLLCETLVQCVNIDNLNFSQFQKRVSYHSLSLVRLLFSLKNFTYLRKLQISYNSFNTWDLCSGLKCCKSLQELYIASCKIRSSGAKEITSSLSTTCRVLDISNNFIDLADFLSDLKDHSSLSQIDVSSNYCALSHQYSFPNCTKLQTLSVSRICLQNRLPLVLTGLRHCTLLQHLYIAFSEFSIPELKGLANLLKHFPMLQTLDVSGNKIGDQGAEILADSLRNNPILTTLCIYDCGISRQTGIRVLDTALNSDTGRVRTRIVSTHCLPPPVCYTFP